MPETPEKVYSDDGPLQDIASSSSMGSRYNIFFVKLSESIIIYFFSDTQKNKEKIRYDIEELKAIAGKMQLSTLLNKYE